MRRTKKKNVINRDASGLNVNPAMKGWRMFKKNIDESMISYNNIKLTY